MLATDAAGEGINLQRGNLMVNYDLPWNPNRSSSDLAVFIVLVRQRFVTSGTSSPVKPVKAMSFNVFLKS